MTYAQRFLALWRDNRGQALILTVVSMTVMLGAGGMAIDAATWYQKHHQEQVAADAASLAAANCLANGASGSTCSSTTDTTDAAGVATTMAAKDGLTIPTSDVTFNTSNKTVTVKVPGTAPSFFASLLGIHTATSSATAGASYAGPVVDYTTVTRTTSTAYATTISGASTITSTTPVTGSALAVFAKDNSCGDYGVDMTGNSSFIDGGVYSNSSIMIDPPTTFDGTVDYGPGTGTTQSSTNCVVATNGGGTVTYDDGNPVSTSGLASYPVPWDTSADPLPSCTMSSTASTWDPPPESNEVFCDTSGACDPSSQEYDGSYVSTYTDDTFICESFDVNSGSITFHASSATALLVYATGGGDAITLGGGSDSYLGEMEAPSGTIDITSGSNNIDGLLEGEDVILGAGSENITGAGPTTYGDATTTTTTKTTQTSTSYSTSSYTTSTATSTSPGSDSLSQ